jgi:hypothetical protein
LLLHALLRLRLCTLVTSRQTALIEPSAPKQYYVRNAKVGTARSQTILGCDQEYPFVVHVGAGGCAMDEG